MLIAIASFAEHVTRLILKVYLLLLIEATSARLKTVHEYLRLLLRRMLHLILLEHLNARAHL